MADTADGLSTQLAPSGGNGPLGCQVAPRGAQTYMRAIDILAGGPPQDRTGNPADFTGGDLERGLGGMAEPASPGDTQYDRIGW